MRLETNRFLKEQSHIEKAIDYAKTRIYICTHYGIAYERMANVTSSGGKDCARRFERTGWKFRVGWSAKMYPRGSEEESAREEEKGMSESVEK